MKKLFPYLLTSLIFALVLNLTQPSYMYVNTHDEDDNIVSGFLMSRSGYKLGKDIFTHHLPGVYVMSESLDKIFSPETTDQSVLVHRSFVTLWNYFWAVLVVFIWGPPALWLIVTVELLRALFLFGLFHAENLVMYPLIYLLLTFFNSQKIRPLLTGLANGMVTILLAPLWPLVGLSLAQFGLLNKKKPARLGWCVLSFLVPVIYLLPNVEIREFLVQFFGYNTLTYVPLLIANLWRYFLTAFLAPVMVLFDRSLLTKVVFMQLLVLFTFVLNFRKIKFSKMLLWGLLLGVIGFRSTPRLKNPSLDFHVLPWVIALATMCWYKYFSVKEKMGLVWWLLLLVPLLLFLKAPAEYFPIEGQQGKMVVRLDDDSPIVDYLKQRNDGGETLFALPAHTLLYQQTGLKPFNKFLFFLPWMERSPILYDDLLESFQSDLPTFIFIDSINFPYFPPEEIQNILKNYREVKVEESQPPIYVHSTFKDFSSTTGRP